MSNNIFRKKAVKSVSVGMWRFEWVIDKQRPEKSYMRIVSQNGVFDMRCNAAFAPCGYLIAAAEQGLTEQLENYARLMFSVAALDVTDQQLDDDLWTAILKWHERQHVKATENAAPVTDHEEAAAQAFMEGVAAYADATPEERKEISKADKAIVREILNEIKEDTANADAEKPE